MQARIAVLIDAENLPSKHWPRLRQRIETLGSLVTCRLFGDFTDGKLSKWVKVAQAEALQTVMQLSGPNASDIAITIAAMDLLQTGKFEAMCLVSSDCDFTPLVHRLRSAGIKVHGFGESKAPRSLQVACTSFTMIDMLKAAPASLAKAA